MASSSGVAGLAVTALVAALVAFGTASLLGPRTPAPPPASPAAEGATADREREELHREVRRLRAEVAELRGARPAPSPVARATPRDGDEAAGESGDAEAGSVEGSPAGGPAAQGPLPATREELVALIDDRIREGGAAGTAPAPARERLSLEEAARLEGLTPFEIDAARRVYRESEDELLLAVMGTTDRERIREEIRALQDDPERKEAFVQKAVGGIFRNIGKMATLEDRRRRALRQAIGEEKAKALEKHDLKPTFEDDDLEDILDGVFK